MYNLSITTLRKIKTHVLYIPLTVIPFLPTDQINKKKNLLFFFFQFCMFVGVSGLEKSLRQSSAFCYCFFNPHH